MTFPHHERVFHPHIRRVIGNQPATNYLHEIRDGIRVLFLIPFRSICKSENRPRKRPTGEKSLEWGIPENPTDVTGLLLKWGQGDEGALERLIPLVHRGAPPDRAALHGGRARGSQPPGDGARQRGVSAAGRREATSTWQDRAHFLAVSARVMRRILVDHARARRSQKRGGDAAQVTFDEALVVTNEPRQDFVALDDALEALATFDERKSRVIELRFFGGLSVEETAAVLKVSPDTVMRDWRLAKAWLQREMRGDRSHDA